MRVSRDGDHAITLVQSPYILGYFQCPMASSATVTHSRRQCCVYGCHNRKGFCPITSSGDRACNCPPSRASKRCPDSESHRLPTLHTINSLDEDVRKTVLQYMRRNSVSSRSGNQWVPNKDDSICNFHFPDNIGPSGFDKKRFPLKEKFFKPERPSSGMEQYVKPRLSFSKSLRQDRAKKRQNDSVATSSTSPRASSAAKVCRKDDASVEEGAFPDALPEMPCEDCPSGESRHDETLSVSSSCTFLSEQSSFRCTRSKIPLINEIHHLEKKRKLWKTK